MKGLRNLNELVEKIKDLIFEYKEKKVGELNLNSNIDYEIYKECEWVSNHIADILGELDATIDCYVEQASEPSDYEQRYLEDERSRHDI